MKARFKDTGEVVDVHWEGNIDAWVGKLGSGRFREFKERELEFLENNNIDWSQRRYEIAKDVLTTIMGRISYDPLMQFSCSGLDGKSPNPYQGIAQISLQAADALIAELRKGGEK